MATHANDREPPPSAPARTSPARKSTEDSLSVTVSDITMVAGKGATATIELQPTGPWKINTEFPARITVRELAFSVTSALKFNSTNPKHESMFKQTSGGIRIDIPFTGDAPGVDEVKAEVRLGICQETCATRTINTSWKVNVTAP